MTISIEMKEQINGKWEEIPIGPYVGLTLRDIYLLLNDKQVVCRFDLPDGIGYLCGTKELAEKYVKRGKRAFKIDQAVAGIEKGANAAILDEIVIPKELAEFAEGAQVMSFKWEGGCDIDQR